MKLVVLNGCATADQVTALLAAKVPAVIATSTAIRDDVAADFASHLYLALGKGATIQDAFQQATSAVRLSYAKGAQKEHETIRAVTRDIACEVPAMEPKWPWRLYGDDLASRERLINVSPWWLRTSVTWATLIAITFFIGINLFYQFYSPPVVLNDSPTIWQDGILAIALWIFVNITMLSFRALDLQYPNWKRIIRVVANHPVRHWPIYLITTILAMLFVTAINTRTSFRDSRYLPVVDLLVDAESEHQDEPVRGYIIFRYTPDPNDDRDLQLCKTVNAFLRDRGSTPDDKAATTYWPSKMHMPANPDYCEAILRSYDRDLADRIMESTPGERRWHAFLVAQSVNTQVIQQMPSEKLVHLHSVQDQVCIDLTMAREGLELRNSLSNWQLLMHDGPESWRGHGLADFVHSTLKRFFPGNIHVNCE